MTPVFDENGLAIEAGELRVFYYSTNMKEYTGWSDEYIHVGVSMPGNSTNIDPGDVVSGQMAVFTGNGWQQKEDHRGDVVYSTEKALASNVDYIGPIREGYTTIPPTTPYDRWNGQEWITDTDAQHAANVAAADADRQARIIKANSYIESKQWLGKAALGRLMDTEKEQYNLWLDYLDELEAIDTSSAPDIDWPNPPEV